MLRRGRLHGAKFIEHDAGCDCDHDDLNAIHRECAGASWWLTRKPTLAEPEKALRPRGLHAMAWIVVAGASAAVITLWLQAGVEVNWG